MCANTEILTMELNDELLVFANLSPLTAAVEKKATGPKRDFLEEGLNVL